MSARTRRALRVDDPVAGDGCHVAQLGSPNGSSGWLRDIVLDEIHPNPNQPRKHFDETSLAALADSIRERGVLQPIIVQPRPAGGYKLIAGERRWRASKIGSTATIPALVAQAVDEGQSIELALIENVAREDLGVIEEARTIAALLDGLGVPAGTLARRLGRSRSDLVHTVRLLDLPDEAIELIGSDELSKGHGKALAHPGGAGRYRRRPPNHQVPLRSAGHGLEGPIGQTASRRPFGGYGMRSGVRHLLASVSDGDAASSAARAPSTGGGDVLPSGGFHDRSGPRSQLAALYMRVADTLERSAQLAEEHAERERRNGRRDSEGVELERARRAREAARRGRELASRLE